MKGLGIILEQINIDNLQNYLNNLRNSDETQKMIDAGHMLEEDVKYCKVCNDLIESGEYYELLDANGDDMSSGLAFDDLYIEKDSVVTNLLSIIEKIISDAEIEIDDIPVGVVFEIDTSQPPYDILTPDEKAKFLTLTTTEKDYLIFVCHILETLAVYSLDSIASEPQTAIGYYKQICALFKPKKTPEPEEDENEDETSIVLDKVYGCFEDLPETNYWCRERGNNCPEELDIEDFDSNNRLIIGDVTYTHTGCTYTKEIILENTYEFLSPGAITYKAGVTYKIQARGKNTFTLVSQKIANTEITGMFAPISNAPGFYNNKFYDNELKSDFDKALFLVVNRHCNGWALPNKVDIWEGAGESIPLGQFLIDEQDGRNCVDDLTKLEAYESSDMLYGRLYALIADEQNLEDGQNHRVKEEDIEAINNYINAKFKEGNIEGNIWVNDKGQLQTESVKGLGEILLKKPKGLSNLLK